MFIFHLKLRAKVVIPAYSFKMQVENKKTLN